jgi:hypothetical protein
MGYAPDKKESQYQHGSSAIDTLGVPKVVIKVIVPLPKAEIRCLF